jgi:cytidine deaminase
LRGAGGGHVPPGKAALDPERAAELLERAWAAAAAAYAPYSSLRVGAAVLAADGRVFAGCNVENASYGLSMCAERVAAFAAVAAGARLLAAVAVASPDARPCVPCGACRQVLAEFGGDGMAVVLERPDGSPEVTELGGLLPRPFRLAPPPSGGGTGGMAEPGAPG